MDIYLDQNGWIALARVFHGKDRDEPSVALLKLLDASVRSGEIRMPVSRLHLLEFMKIGNQERRKRLAQAFVRFSQGFIVKPAELIMCVELENWARGRPPKARNVIQRGLLAAMGDYQTQAHSLGVTVGEVELEDRVGDNPLSWYFALSRPEFDAAAGQIHASADRYVATVDSVREQWADLPQSERLAIYAQGVLHDIMAAVPRIPGDAQLAIDRLLSLTAEDFLSAIEEIPSINVLIRIGEAIARDLNQPTKPNDLWDLAFLSIAVPYFDAALTEGTWVHHTTELGFDERYSCNVLKRLTDLTPHVTEAAT